MQRSSSPLPLELILTTRSSGRGAPVGTDAEGISKNLKGMHQPSRIEMAALAWLKILSHLIYMCSLGLSLYGLFRCWTHRGTVRAGPRLLALPLVAVWYCASLHSLFFGTSRFHFVFVPLL